MDLSAILDAITKLGGMGVMGALVFWLFFRYIPQRDIAVAEDRKLDRELQERLAKSCHEAHAHLQEKFVSEINAERRTFATTLSAMTQALNRFEQTLHSKQGASR